MWPVELREWVEAVVLDETVIAAILPRARNRDRAREAIQEAVSHVLGPYNSGRFNSYDYFASWIAFVANNALVDEFRRFGRERPLISADALPARESDDSAERRRALVRQAIEELPLGWGEAVRLRFEEGLGYKELGQRLGCSATTAWKRLRKPLAQLRASLLQCDPELFRSLDVGPTQA